MMVSQEVKATSYGGLKEWESTSSWESQKVPQMRVLLELDFGAIPIANMVLHLRKKV